MQIQTQVQAPIDVFDLHLEVIFACFEENLMHVMGNVVFPVFFPLPLSEVRGLFPSTCSVHVCPLKGRGVLVQ